MANIWKQNKDVKQHPKRNNFDLSFQSHSTFKFGYLYPVFKKRVVPGDSFRIDSAFDLKMMPVEFPIQSRIRAHMHYFYVRNKNLWNNWEDWISGLKSNTQCPHPYLSVSDADIKTGSIHDFLGVPTTVVGKGVDHYFSDLTGFKFLGGGFIPFNGSFSDDVLTVATNVNADVYRFLSHRLTSISEGVFKINDDYYIQLTTRAAEIASDASTSYGVVLNFVYSGDDVDYSSDAIRVGDKLYHVGPYNISDESGKFSISELVASEIQEKINLGRHVYALLTVYFGTPLSYHDTSVALEVFEFVDYFEVPVVDVVGYQQWSDLGIDCYNSKILLNALPYRAYESIYRAFYANSVLQPLVVNGQKEYNKFITNDADGADSTDYHLFKRNYELDFLTSALPSPMAGPAPMVGVTALGNISIVDENGITTAQAEVDDQGNITNVAVTSPIASVEHNRTLFTFANSGFNINDFRNANALTLLLEQTMRSGFRYQPFIGGHFGVEPKYVELDMPEFLGGFSRDVDISQVVSQADTVNGENGLALGDFSGLGRVVGGSNHSITHYCDDYGYIIGIMCITPTPAYSQLLPKENICPTNYLDYYFPEMAQLGMQPIPYSEVAPLQTVIDQLTDSDVKLSDTFGYQRPNYDMVANVDEVHGEFRATLSQQLINRIFDGRPELGSSFLEIDPSEVNDIFINRNSDDDVFIGHLAFRVYAKRPIPRIHMPSLGR